MSQNPPPQPPRKPNPPAIVSLVSALAVPVTRLIPIHFGLMLLVTVSFTIIAIATGHIALRRVKRDPAVGWKGAAIAGLILGYISAGVLVIFVGIAAFVSIVFGPEAVFAPFV